MILHISGRVKTLRTLHRLAKRCTVLIFVVFGHRALEWLWTLFSPPLWNKDVNLMKSKPFASLVNGSRNTKYAWTHQTAFRGFPVSPEASTERCRQNRSWTFLVQITKSPPAEQLALSLSSLILLSDANTRCIMDTLFPGRVTTGKTAAMRSLLKKHNSWALLAVHLCFSVRQMRGIMQTGVTLFNSWPKESKIGGQIIASPFHQCSEIGITEPSLAIWLYWHHCAFQDWASSGFHREKGAKWISHGTAVQEGLRD